MSGYWAVSGRDLIFDWTPATTDTFKLTASVRSLPHASDASRDTIFGGNVVAVEKLSTVLLYAVTAKLCRMMANKAKNTNEMALWERKEGYYLTKQQGVQEVAEKSIMLSKTGSTSNRVRSTFP